jgi:hypothetical protein
LAVKLPIPFDLAPSHQSPLRHRVQSSHTCHQPYRHLPESIVDGQSDRSRISSTNRSAGESLELNFNVYRGGGNLPLHTRAYQKYKDLLRGLLHHESYLVSITRNQEVHLHLCFEHKVDISGSKRLFSEVRTERAVTKFSLVLYEEEDCLERWESCSHIDYGCLEHGL